MNESDEKRLERKREELSYNYRDVRFLRQSISGAISGREMRTLLTPDWLESHGNIPIAELKDEDFDETAREMVAKRFNIEGWIEDHRDDPVAKEMVETADKESSNGINSGHLDGSSGLDAVLAGIHGMLNPETRRLLVAVCCGKIFLPEEGRYRTILGSDLVDFNIEENQAILTTATSHKITIDLHEWTDDDIEVLKDTLTSAEEYSKVYADFIEKLKDANFSSREELETWFSKDDVSINECLPIVDRIFPPSQ